MQSGSVPGHLWEGVRREHDACVSETSSPENSQFIFGPCHEGPNQKDNTGTNTYPLKLQALGKLIFYIHRAHVTQKVENSLVFLRGKNRNQHLSESGPRTSGECVPFWAFSGPKRATRDTSVATDRFTQEAFSKSESPMPPSPLKCTWAQISPLRMV